MSRLKQIKNDLGEFGKSVVDSYISSKPKHVQKEEKHEEIRCKVDIFQGYDTPYKLIDTFIVNTNNIHETMRSITKKYGKNVQYKITNLYDEKIIAKSFVYVGKGNKEKEDKECFNHRMDIIKKILKLKDEGKSFEEIKPKFAHLAGESYIKKVYNSSEEIMIQELRNIYNNQSLGSFSQPEEILSKELNTNKDNKEIEE